MGCAYWEQSPHLNAGIRTVGEWEAAYGRPIAGFDDDLKIRSWPPSLYARRVRAIYDAAPTPEAKTLVWEIARLQDILVRAHNAILILAKEMPHTPARVTLMRLAELLAKEPSVCEAIDKAYKRRTR